MMKRFQLFALSSFLFVVHSQAGDPPIKEVYQEEAAALAEALEAFQEDPASDEHPVITKLAEALLEILTADEACYRTRHAEIEKLAQKLRSLTTDLSFPCLDEPAYDATRGIASTVAALQQKAKVYGVLAATPFALAADREALAFLDPPKCTVKLVAFMGGEDPFVPEWLPTSEWGTLRADRFDDFALFADGRPFGGTFEWNARELGGKTLVGFGYPSRTNLNFPTAPIPDAYVIFNMQGTSSGGFYVIEVEVIYHAPDGPTCSDTGRIVIPPR